MEHEAIIRLGSFLGIFAVLATLETLSPRRVRRQPRKRRWITNWSVTILDALTLRALALAMPFLAVATTSISG